MAERVYGVAVNENFSGIEVILHLIESARTFLESDVEQAKEFFEKGRILSNNIQFHEGHAECLCELGKISFKQDRISDTFKYLQEAILMFEKTDNKIKYFECNTFLSEICIGIGNYGQALEFQIAALNTAKEINDTSRLADSYNKTGNINKVLSQFLKAIDYHNQALKLYEQIKDIPGIANSNYYLGNCYNWSGDLEKAISHLEKSLEEADKLNDPFLQVKPTGSLATVFTKLKEHSRAVDFFYRAIDLVNITGEVLLKADLLRNLGNLFTQMGEHEQAKASLEESLAIATTQKRGYPQNLIHLGLANVYEKTGDHQKSLMHFKKYHEISSELLNEEVALKTKGIQLRYDFEEAKKEKELAEKSALLKDQFIANISHEIRTPLNGVLGMADLLSDTNPTPEQLEYINTIKLSANNLIYIINDILDFSKMQSGELSIKNSEFNIRDLLSDIAQILKVKCDEKRISLLISVDDEIPEMIIGDSARLKQILMNLLTNSIKFTDKGNVKTEVKLTNIKGLNISLLFTISDTGRGIPSDKIKTIFDTFSQVENDYSKSSGGAGLGLAIVRQLVQLCNGEISVNSHVGTGSVFKIELPFKSSALVVRKKGTSRDKSTIETTDLTGLKVLLVEDNKVNQFLAQKLLDRMGLSVFIANNGNEAIDYLKKMSFSLILMDVQMPEMNGYQLTEIIRTSLPDPINKVPIIALTAYASLQEKEKAIAVGMSDYITKPYSPHELMTAITKQVNTFKGTSTIHTTDNSEEVTGKLINATTNQLLLLFNDNVEDVLSLLHMLINQIPLLISEVGKAIESKNWPLTFQETHKLRSSVNLLKLPGITNLASEIEEYSRDEVNTEKIPVIFSQFKSHCEKAVGLLKDEVIRLKKI